MLPQPIKILTLVTALTAITFTPGIGIFNEIDLKSALAQTQTTEERNDEREFHQENINKYQSELEQAKKAGDRTAEIQILQKAGQGYQYFGDYQNAIELYQQGLTIAREIQDHNQEKNLLNSLARVHNEVRPSGGIEFLEQQLQMMRSKGDRAGERVVLGELGSVSLTLENYQKTIEIYTQYLPLVRQINDRESEAVALWNLAQAYTQVEDYQQAIKQLEQASILIEQSGNIALLSSYLAQLGETYHLQGNDEKAIQVHTQILQISKDNGDEFWATEAIKNIAIIEAALDRPQKAIELLEIGLAIAQYLPSGLSESQQHQILDMLSLSYARLGNYTKAIELQQQMAVIDGDPGRIFQDHLGFFLFRTGQLMEAENALRKAVDQYARSRSTLASGHNNVTSGGYDETIRANYDLTLITYRTLQQVLVAQKDTDAALEVAEEARARAFANLLATRLAVDMKSQATITSPSIEQIKQIAQAENSTLVQYSVLYDEQPDRLGEFRFGKEEPKETTLLIWVVKPTGEIVFRSVDLKPLLRQQRLQDLVRTTRDSIGVRGRGLVVQARPNEQRQTNQQGLQQLYQILIKPIADQLPTQEESLVTFMPQDALFLVPFAALQDTSGKYLIENHTVAIAPSIQTLDLTRQYQQRLQAAGNNVLVVGNPTMPSIRPNLLAPLEPLSTLPGAEREAKIIAQFFNTQPILGSAATESTVVQKLPKARIIHLATHGILENLQGLQSAIALAPSESDDGFLSAREVLNLKLNAELAVLSACDTGRGEISGDGVVGISRSFIGAGVPSVIVSLWSVPDAPTASLMTQFYRNFQQNSNKAQALRNAMLTTMKQHPNPRDWAAFTLIGEE